MIKVIILLLILISNCYADNNTSNSSPLFGDESGTNAGRYRSIKFTDGTTTNNGDGSLSVSTGGGGGSGDITAVGDCATGACFSGASGTTLTFNNAGGDATLAYDGTYLTLDKILKVTKNSTSVTPPFPTQTVTHVVGADSDNIVQQTDVFGGHNVMDVRRANGTAASPSALLLDDEIAAFAGRGYGDATTYAAGSGGKAALTMYAAENWSATNQGTYLLLSTTPKGSLSLATALKAYDNADIGMGRNASVGTFVPNYFGYSTTDIRLLTILGAASSSSRAVLELVANTGNTTLGNAVGTIDFTAASQTGPRIAQILGLMSGSTAGNYGGNLVFYTKADAGSLAAVLTLQQDKTASFSGNVLISNLTASTPVVADSSKNLTSGSYSGNTTKLVTTTGTLTSGNGSKFDASGNLIDSGNAYVDSANTVTLTNKRITKRVVTASDATSITPNSDSADITYQANTQAAGTLTINADGGTPTNGQSWVLKVKCTNAQTLSWNSVFAGGTTSLPTSTTGSSKIDYYAFIYDTVNSKWHYTGTAAGF